MTRLLRLNPSIFDCIFCNLERERFKKNKTSVFQCLSCSIKMCPKIAQKVFSDIHRPYRNISWRTKEVVLTTQNKQSVLLNRMMTVLSQVIVEFLFSVQTCQRNTSKQAFISNQTLQPLFRFCIFSKSPV